MASRARKKTVIAMIAGLPLVAITGFYLLRAFSHSLQVVTFLDESVIGLQPGAQVTLRGVPVGVVSDISLVSSGNSLSRREIVAVTLLINDPGIFNETFQTVANDPIGATGRLEKQGFRARISPVDVTGRRILEILRVDRKKGLETIRPIRRKEHDRRVYLLSVRSSRKEMLDTLNVIVRELQDADIPRLTRSMEKLAKNLEMSSQTVKTFTEHDLAELIDQLNRATEPLPKAAAALERSAKDVRVLSENLNALVSDLRDSMKKEIRPMLRNLLDTAERSPEIARRAEQSWRRLDEGLGTLNEILSRDVGPAIRALRTTTETLNRLVEHRLPQSMEHINQTTAKLPQAVEELNRSMRKMNRLMSGDQAQLLALLENLRRITHDLTQLTGRAKSFPSHTLFGDPPPRSLGRRQE